VRELDLTVIIVNWNAYEFVFDCIRATSETITSTSYEIIVVDNSQSEASRKSLHEHYGSAVRIMHNDKNVGFAAANNQAIQVARGRYLLLLNPDAAPLTGAIDGMIELLKRVPTIGILGCDLLNGDGSFQQSAYSLYPSLLSAALDATAVLAVWRKLQNSIRTAAREREYESVAWVKGACVFVRREVLREIGLLDERFFLYSEDADLCKRASASGWSVATTRKWRMLHHGQRSSGQVPVASVRAYYDSYVKFVAKHGGNGLWGIRLVLLTILLRISAFERMAALLFTHGPTQGLSRVRAYWHFLLAKGPSSSSEQGVRS
jgi:GT2 family glycosyltransferase